MILNLTQERQNNLRSSIFESSIMVGLRSHDQNLKNMRKNMDQSFIIFDLILLLVIRSCQPLICLIIVLFKSKFLEKDLPSQNLTKFHYYALFQLYMLKLSYIGLGHQLGNGCKKNQALIQDLRRILVILEARAAMGNT